MSFGINNTTNGVHLLPLHIPELRFLIASSCIILYSFGYTGCILSIITFSSRKLRHHSTGFLFLIMAFVDILNLFASLQYFLDVIYEINVYSLSIHWCRFFTIFNYELYFGFSWIFAFISLDRWIKVEWPTKSQSWCTREKYVYLCLISFGLSLIQNIIYAFLCFDAECNQKHLLCEIFIHIIYISVYMTVPILIIVIAISRTCLITIHLRRRFRQTNTANVPSITTEKSVSMQLEPIPYCHSTTGTSRLSNSFFSSISSSTNPGAANQWIQTSQRLATFHRRRSRVDAQMVVLISINVAPFILVHIITEIAYLFEKYSSLVAQSKVARLIIIFIYLSWYLISATRFYTNCLLSRIYRAEFKHRLQMLTNGCKLRPNSTASQLSSRRPSSRYGLGGSLVNGCESIAMNVNHLQ